MILAGICFRYRTKDLSTQITEHSYFTNKLDHVDSHVATWDCLFLILPVLSIFKNPPRCLDLHPGSAIHGNHEAETIEPLNRQCPLVPRFSDGYNRKPKVKQTLYSAANTTNTCFKLGALWISEFAIVCFVLIFQFSFFQNIETVPDQATHYRRSDLPGTYRIEY